MKRLSVVCTALVVLVTLLLLTQHVRGQALNVVYGSNGLQQLTYNSVTLEDTQQYPADAFHIWHMKVTDLLGNVLTNGQYGWGEINSGRNWDSSAHKWTYNYSWGNVSVQYVAGADRLDMIVTEQNNRNSGVILSGVVLYPLALHFPQLPAGFNDASYPQLSYTNIEPGVVTADYGSGEAAAVVTSATKPVYSGFWPTGNGTSYTAMIATTTPDGLATFQPHFDRPVHPGETDTFTVSLRFAPSGTSAVTVASDAYSNFAQTFPSTLNWTDRRPIGTVYLATAPSTGSVNQPGGFPNNPRRYFNDGNASDFDVTNPFGLAAFQKRILQQAQQNVLNLQAMGAQGAVTWDIEGQQYPHATSYVCSPDQIGLVAPEMESLVLDIKSPYFGQRLDDAYFRTMRDAGFSVGVCVRPQQFTLSLDGSATQVVLDAASAQAALARKIAFAHDRWGARLFYVDSSVDAYGGALNPGIFQALQQQFPDSLLMPEESTPRHYAYTAPFQTFIFHGDTGTDSAVRAIYPNAFSNILINDVNASTLNAAVSKLTASVKAGDVLMGHVDYADPNNATIVSIERAAGYSGTTTTPTTTTTTPTTTVPTPTTPTTTVTTPVVTTPVITSPVVTTPVVTTPAVSTANVAITSPGTGDTVSGTVSVQAVVNVNLDPAGSFLMVDGREYGTQRVLGPPYAYALDTTTLSNDTHTLQLWAHDTGNNIWVSSTVPIVVSNNAAATSPVGATPVTPAPAATSSPVAVTFPSNGQAISGVISVIASIAQQLDAAGSFLMVDGAQFGYSRVFSGPFLYSLDTAALAAGMHTVQVWAHTINNSTIVSDPVNVIVSH